jgi:hypothetical protein
VIDGSVRRVWRLRQSQPLGDGWYRLRFVDAYYPDPTPTGREYAVVVETYLSVEARSRLTTDAIVELDLTPKAVEVAR